MGKVIDRTGHRFGRLTVIARADNDKRGRARWSCRCDCDAEVVVSGNNLQSGNTRSCGCLDRELSSDRGRAHLTVHGHTRTGWVSPTYRSWLSMKARCLNPNHHAYPAYGGRGITVCDEWLGPDGFARFLADMGERPGNPDGWSSSKGYWSLDRIDPDGDYEPSNCRWATPTQQTRNVRGKEGHVSV
jgi:hypothetical protein